MTNLKHTDSEIFNLINKEVTRQNNGLEMIPSENHTSSAVLEALGSRLTDKYSEGYPGQRYYGGCQYIDEIENLARDRAKKLFGANYANVQAHSGSPANLAVYFALLKPGDLILGLDLYHGGHMSHGLRVNYSGIFYKSISYHCQADGYIDWQELRKLALEYKPKIIVAGGSAYPRQYEWEKFKEIADESKAFLLADMSHVAGLVAGGVHPNPVGIADVITTTTHKTLRGPRGAIILANGLPSTPRKKVEIKKENIPTLIDRAIIPGLQGGPHNNQTAAIAVALKEALQPDFKIYAQQIIKNAKTLAEELLKLDYKLITGGTETHLLLIDLNNKNISGKQAEQALEKAGITVNKNTIPNDTRPPFDPSGIRLGTPALTSRGMTEKEMVIIAKLIDKTLKNIDSKSELEKIKQEVLELCSQFPINR